MSECRGLRRSIISLAITAVLQRDVSAEPRNHLLQIDFRLNAEWRRRWTSSMRGASDNRPQSNNTTAVRLS